MYPNYKAELARNGFTLEKLAEEMEKKGFKRTVPTLSQKLGGKYPITLDEAKVMKEVVKTDLPLEVLFEEAS